MASAKVPGDMAHAPAKRKHQFRKPAKKAAAPVMDPNAEGDAAQQPLAEQQGGAPMPIPQHAKGGLVSKAAKMYGKSVKGFAEGGKVDDVIEAAKVMLKVAPDKDTPVSEIPMRLQSMTIASDRIKKANGEKTRFPDDNPEGYPSPTRESEVEARVVPKHAKGGIVNKVASRADRMYGAKRVAKG